METNELTPVQISLNTIEDFLNDFKSKNRQEATIHKYASDLKSFFKFLPEDKVVHAGTIHQWKDYLVSKKYAVRTVNTRISSCNTFLEYLDRKSWQISSLSLKDENNLPGISREEYHILLNAAHEADKEWLYFMIKAFCCLGLSVSELPFLRVDDLVAGRVMIDTKARTRSIYIPKVLQTEFLLYAKRANINSGSLFKSPLGEPLTKKYISKELHALCKRAGLPEMKGNPKALRALYFDTYSSIRSSSSVLFDNEYSKLLEEEDMVIGWERLAV